MNKQTFKAYKLDTRDSQAQRVVIQGLVSFAQGKTREAPNSVVNKDAWLRGWDSGQNAKPGSFEERTIQQARQVKVIEPVQKNKKGKR